MKKVEYPQTDYKDTHPATYDEVVELCERFKEYYKSLGDNLKGYNWETYQVLNKPEFYIMVREVIDYGVKASLNDWHWFIIKAEYKKPYWSMGRGDYDISWSPASAAYIVPYTTAYIQNLCLNEKCDYLYRDILGYRLGIGTIVELCARKVKKK